MKGKIGIIVLIITIALIGLISIQLYWIGQANELSQEQFNRGVSFALKDVSRVMENREASGFIEKSVSVDTDNPAAASDNAKLNQGRGVLLNNNKVVLGVDFRNIDEKLIREKKLVSGYGVYIENVYAGSLAQSAGIQAGDIITRVAETEVNSITELIMAMDGFEQGDDLNLTIERPGDKRDIARAEPFYPNVEEGLPYTLARNEFAKMIIDSFAKVSQLAKLAEESASNHSYVATFQKSYNRSTGEYTEVFYGSHEKQNLASSVFLKNPSSEAKAEIQKKTTDFMADLVREFMTKNTKTSLFERIKDFDIDELLTRELREQGIKIDPQWTVVNSSNNPVMCSDNFDPVSEDEIFQAQLFTHLAEKEPSYLKVYFPQQESYLRAASGAMPFVALLFMLAIIACFYYAIRTLLNQKKISDMKTDFINNMTHELKTPVATIKLASEMMLEKNKTKTDAPSDRYLNIIQDENTRLSQQIERVLEIAKYEKGNLNLEKKTLDLHEILEEALAKSSALVDMKGGQIIRSFTQGSSQVLADRQHLVNVFHNLIDNAIKYSPEKPVIEISTSRQGDELVVGVKDNGIGMSKDAQKKIFEKFYRVPTGNLHDIKGFGLGLSYVKLMMEAHGGKIEVQSKPNQGSLFELFFPKNTLAVT